MTEQGDQRAEIVAAATGSYPPGVARPLFVDRHRDHAAVLLETGGSGHPYPYFVLCQRDENGSWSEGYSANFPGWYQTDDDDGVVVYWGEAEGLSEPIEVEFRGRRWPTEVRDGVFWAVWWDEQDPDNLIPAAWPEVARGQAGPSSP
jgi:hypothetical protein